jgi:hypothetical protein
VRRIFLEENTDQFVGRDGNDQSTASHADYKSPAEKVGHNADQQIEHETQPRCGQASSRYELEYLRTMLRVFVVESEKEDKQRKRDCQSRDANYGQPAENLRHHIGQRIDHRHHPPGEQGRRDPRGNVVGRALALDL